MTQLPRETQKEWGHKQVSPARGRRTECSSADHVIDAARRADDYVHAIGQSVQVFAHGSATDARLTLRVHVVAQCYHHLLYLQFNHTNMHQVTSFHRLNTG